MGRLEDRGLSAFSLTCQAAIFFLLTLLMREKNAGGGTTVYSCYNIGDEHAWFVDVPQQ